MQPIPFFWIKYLKQPNAKIHGNCNNIYFYHSCHTQYLSFQQNFWNNKSRNIIATVTHFLFSNSLQTKNRSIQLKINMCRNSNNAVSSLSDAGITQALYWLLLICIDQALSIGPSTDHTCCILMTFQTAQAFNFPNFANVNFFYKDRLLLLVHTWTFWSTDIDM